MLHEPLPTPAPHRFSYNPDDYVVVEGHRDHTEMTERRKDGEPSPLAGTMLPAMIQGGYQGSIYIVGGDGDHHRAGSERPLEGSFDVMDLFYNEVRKVPGASVVLNKRDLPVRPEPGTLKFILEIEGGHPFQEDYSSGKPLQRRLHLLRTFFRLGMRHMHVTHNGRNELADGHNDEITGGRLSEFGVAGPLLDIFFVRTSLTRHAIVATKAATQVFSHLMKIVVYGAPLIAVKGKGLPPWWVFALAVPLSMVGTAAGGVLLNRLSDVNFKRYLRLILTAIALVYLVQAAQLYIRG